MSEDLLRPRISGAWLEGCVGKRQVWGEGVHGKYVHGAIGIGGSQSSKLVMTWGGTWRPKAEGAGRFQAL